MLPIAYPFHRAILLKRADRVTFPVQIFFPLYTKYINQIFNFNENKTKKIRTNPCHHLILFHKVHQFLSSIANISIYIYIFFSLKTSPISNSPISSWFLSKLFSQQLIYMIYIYIYTHFRAFVRLLKSNTVDTRWDRNDGAKYGAGKHGWWRDERPRTTAAKKSVFFAAAAWSGMARRGEARRETRV